MVIRKGYLAPSLAFRLMGPDGALPLAGVTASAELHYPSGDVRTRVLAVDAGTGLVTLAWQAGDTDETGLVVVEVDFTAGGVTTRLQTPLQVEVRP